MKMNMTDQELFEALSELECTLFYADDYNPTDARKAAHEAVNNALIAFSEATGCHN